MSAEKRHVIFVVEDNPEMAEEIVDRLTVLGFDHRLATTQEEARVEIERGGFCLVLLDLHLKPHARSMVADTEIGFAILRQLRERFPERTADLKFVVQIIVMTGHAKTKEYVRKAFQLDANDFLHKPFSDNEVSLEDAIRQCFRKAGREDHAACVDGASARTASVAPSQAPPQAAAVAVSARAASAGPSLVIDGSKGSSGTMVAMNGELREMPDSKFVVLLRCVSAHMRKAGSWSTREALGIPRDRDSVSRVRSTFKDLVPEGFKLIEGDRRRSFRLNPGVVVERVEWEVLAEHSNELVRKIAKEWVGRGR